MRARTGGTILCLALVTGCSGGPRIEREPAPLVDPDRGMAAAAALEWRAPQESDLCGVWESERCTGAFALPGSRLEYVFRDDHCFQVVAFSRDETGNPNVVLARGEWRLLAEGLELLRDRPVFDARVCGPWLKISDGTSLVELKRLPLE